MKSHLKEQIKNNEINPGNIATLRNDALEAPTSRPSHSSLPSGGARTMGGTRLRREWSNDTAAHNDRDNQMRRPRNRDISDSTMMLAPGRCRAMSVHGVPAQPVDAKRTLARPMFSAVELHQNAMRPPMDCSNLGVQHWSQLFSPEDVWPKCERALNKKLNPRTAPAPFERTPST